MVAERLPRHKRRTHRGRRSFSSLSDRRAFWQSNRKGLPQQKGACQPAPAPTLESEMFTFLYLNIRGFVSHEAELSAVAKQLGNPTFIGLVETFLTKSVKQIHLPGYTLVSRRDRKDDSGWGGILFFVKDALGDIIVHIGDSAEAERS